MSIGKSIRLERIINRETKRTIIVPMDHGVSSGPMEGLIDIKSTIEAVSEGGANAVLMHKGLVRAGHRGRGKDVGLIVHLSASTDHSPTKNDKVLVCTVEEAIKLGADGVSIHVNLGAPMEREMLRDFGIISKVCEEWGMPLLAMVYARGHDIKPEDQYDKKFVAHCARLGEELGADIVKVPYTGDVESFKEVIRGTHIPVVIAGGPKMKTEKDVLLMVEGAIKAGAAGLSIGRNIFQAKDPRKITAAMRMIVHEGKTAEEASEFLHK